MVATLRPHTDAVKAALEAAGVTVGLGGKPATAGTKWAALHPMGALEPSSLADAHGGFVYTVQAISVGQGPEQAEWVADKVRAALIAPLTISGRTWLGVEHEAQPLARDDSVNPPLFYVTETFRIRTH